MKNLGKILLTALSVLILAVSVAAIYASSVPTQSTQGIINFSSANGIRWHEGYGAFEVYNAAGFSHIGSGKWISSTGEIADTKAAENYEQALGNKTYNIMQDISYEKTSSFYAAFETSKITIGAGGIIDGRGFYLKGFPVRSLDTEYGSALFYQNSGTIRNLNMSDFIYSAGSKTFVSLLCIFNSGLIDTCAAYGTFLDIAATNVQMISVYNSYGTIQNCVNNVSVTASTPNRLCGIIAFNGGTVQNCINNGNLTLSGAGAIAAGISGGVGTVINCINTGRITAVYGAAGISAPAESEIRIVGCVNDGMVSANYSSGILLCEYETDSIEVSGCTNNGIIHYNSSSSGIGTGIAGVTTGIKFINIVAGKNQNYGYSDFTVFFDLYCGFMDEKPTHYFNYGIRYNFERSAFEIFSPEGLTHIGSNTFFSCSGHYTSDGREYSAKATPASVYYIINDINLNNYDSYTASTFKNAKITVGENGVVDGQGYKLTGFPMRKPANYSYGGNNYLISSALFYVNYGTIKNISMVDTDYTEINSAVYAQMTAASLCGLNLGKIENCTTGGSVSLSASVNGSVAGIAGYNQKTITGCTNNTSYTAVGNTVNLAGIAAFDTDGTYEYCVNNGDLSGGQHSGGIFSQIKQTIVDTPVKVYLTGCVNNGDLSGSLSAGGMISYFDEFNSEGFFTGCQNNGKISGNNTAYAGGFIGFISGCITISNSENTGGVKEAVNAGGFLGYLMSGVMETTVSGSVNSGSIEGISAGTAGGYIGVLDGSDTVIYINSSINDGEVTNGGGFVGTGHTIRIFHCINNADVYYGSGFVSVSGNGGYVTISDSVNFGYSLGNGGMIGTAGTSGILIANSSNYGHVQSTGAAGGLIGTVAAYGSVSLYNSFNFNYISGINDVGGLIGGFYGERVTESFISGCINYGYIASNGNNVGGIVGYCQEYSKNNLTISNCSNSMTVVGKLNTGGIVGNGSTININDCSNVSKVTGTDGVGGIIGSAKNVVLNRSINYAIVTGTANKDGLIGKNTTCTIKDSINYGTLA